VLTCCQVPLQGELGGVFEDISTVLQKAPQYLTTIVNILADPALPEVQRLIERMRASSAVTAPAPSGGVQKVGIGLHKAVTPMKFFVHSQEHKWVLPVTIAGAILVPALIGFAVGRLTKR
jgi:hypothetical protein